MAYEFKPRFDIVSHGDLLEQSATVSFLIHYYYQGVPMAMGFTTLKNGMKLGVTAPEREIYAGRQFMTFLVLIVTVVIGLLSTLLAIRAADRIVRPLHDISEAACRLGRGEYDQPLDSTAQDEIGRLAGHMNDTMERMRKYVGAMQKQAYQDELTAVKNVAAYDRKVYDLNQKIAAGQVFIIMEVIALDTVDTGDCIIKRPSKHGFQPVAVGLVTQVFRVLDFMFDSVADVVDDVFGLHENRVQRHTGVDGPAVEGLGGDFRLAAVDEEDAEAAEDQGQRQGDATDDGQKAGPYGLHHERAPPLCS